jgi:hypothetical protein
MIPEWRHFCSGIGGYVQIALIGLLTEKFSYLQASTWKPDRLYTHMQVKIPVPR